MVEGRQEGREVGRSPIEGEGKAHTFVACSERGEYKSVAKVESRKSSEVVRVPVTQMMISSSC